MTYITNALGETAQAPSNPLYFEDIFKALPDRQLIAKLKELNHQHPHEYDPEKLWRSYIVYYLLGLPSISELILMLQSDPFIASLCGIGLGSQIPSQSTFSRFLAGLTDESIEREVDGIFAELSRKLRQVLPDFGKSVAVDATGLKALPGRDDDLEPDDYLGRDEDAGWVKKSETEDPLRITWGYKLTLLVDTFHELPLAFVVTGGRNSDDVRAATAALKQASLIDSQFRPDLIIGNASYCRKSFERLISDRYGAVPIIKARRFANKTWVPVEETDWWRSVYRRKLGAERLFAFLKEHGKLNSIIVRGIDKVRIHCALSLIVLQARALAARSLSPETSVN